MSKTPSAYWEGKDTWALSKAAHKLADKVTDANLSKEIHDAIAALDKNADELLSAAVKDRDAFNDALSNLHEDLSSLTRDKETWEGQKAELRKELDGLKGDVKTLKGKVK